MGPEPRVVWRWSPIQPGAMERLDEDGVWRMILGEFETTTPPVPILETQIKGEGKGGKNG